MYALSIYHIMNDDVIPYGRPSGKAVIIHQKACLKYLFIPESVMMMIYYNKISFHSATARRMVMAVLLFTRLHTTVSRPFRGRIF